MKKVLAILLTLCMVVTLLASCGGPNKQSDSNTSSALPDSTKEGTFIITLYEDKAPITCENFENLVKDGFYDGLTFHRIVDGFCAQGGDPNGNGSGGSANKIKGEFRSNGVQNDLKHTRGVISMARSANPDSASSQFFIMHKDAPHLDGQYAAFGKVVEGIEVVDEIASVQTDFRDKPVTPQVMKSVTIE